MGIVSSAVKLGKTVSKITDDIKETTRPINKTNKIVEEPFKKTRKAYKLFVKKDDKLYPLFVNAADEVPQGEFLEADFPDVAFKGKTLGGTEGFYVPTKGAQREPTRYYDAEGLEITKKEYDSLGSNQKEFASVVKGEEAKKTGDTIIIPDEETRQKLIEAGFITKRAGRTEDAPYGKVTAVAARPGWHSSVNPVAEHLGPQDLKITKAEAKKLIQAGINPKAIRTRGDQYYVKRRAEDHVWAEVDMADDTSDELLEYMAQTGRTDINDKVPVGGSYSYVDGQADGDTWIVGGNMRVNRTLTREEAKALQNELGVKDLPYRDEVETILGRKFAEGGLVGEENMYKGEQDYLTTASSGVDMNKGRTPILEEQMEMFNEGGLKDEGGEVDPESGNDVPIGSTKKEVRDDIPAMLSEGEFVFPADVVRYIGLEKLMELRQSAKMGLKKMEAMGQMGNSEEATIPDDMPFNMADLIIVSGEPKEDKPREMAQGGVIRAQTGTFVPNTGIAGQRESYFANQQPTVTPSFIPPSSVAPPPPPPSPSTGYLPKFVTQASNYSGPAVDAVTGTTADTTTSTTNTGTGTTDDKFFQTVEDVYTTIKYINKETGEIRDFYFYQGNPVTPIPEGFVPYDETTDTTVDDLESTQVETALVRDTGGGGRGTINIPQPEKVDWSTYSKEELQDAYDKNKKTRITLTAMGAINPLIALFGQGATRMQEKEILAAMKEKGIEPPEVEGGIFNNITKFVSNLFDTDEKEVVKTLTSGAPTKSLRPKGRPLMTDEERRLIEGMDAVADAGAAPLTKTALDSAKSSDQIYSDVYGRVGVEQIDLGKRFRSDKSPEVQTDIVAGLGSQSRSTEDTIERQRKKAREDAAAERRKDRRREKRKAEAKKAADRRKAAVTKAKSISKSVKGKGAKALGASPIKGKSSGPFAKGGLAGRK